MSRRAAKPAKDKFAELRAAREGGGRAKQWKPAEDDALYDEVSEEDYKTLVKQRLARDDFIEDDDGSGYIDNGMDVFEETGEFGSDAEEDDEERRKRKGTSLIHPPNSQTNLFTSLAARKKTKVALEAQRAKDQAYAAKQQQEFSIADYRPAVSTEKEQDFMSSLLGQLDAAPSHKSGPAKRKLAPSFAAASRPFKPPTVVRGSTLKRKPSPTRGMAGLDVFRSDVPSSDPPSDAGFGNFLSDANDVSDHEWNITASPTKKPKREPSSSPVRQLSGLAVNDDDDEYDDGDTGFWEEAAGMDVDVEEGVKGKGKAKLVNPASVLPNGRALKLEPKPEPDPDPVELKPPSWLSLHASLNASAVKEPETLGSDKPVAAGANDAKALEKDGSLRIFWLDYLELESRLYLVGKVVDKANSTDKVTKWASCCVAIEGIERNLFVLPRKYRMEFGHETDSVPTEEEIYEEFDLIRQKHGIKRWAFKPVNRKYAFGEVGIPEGESQWMKVVYGFDEPMLPIDLSGATFSRVLGTNTSAFELFVLKRKIMGPCWLEIKECELSNKGFSWCKLEVLVRDPKNVNPLSEDVTVPTPALTILSLSSRTVVNHKENKREIVGISLRIWENANIEDSTPPEKQPSVVHTIVRPLGKLPAGFEAKVRAEKAPVKPMVNEKMLLNNLLATLQKYDPDVIVGHEFLGFTLDVLLQRMREHKVEHWSRLGRFRRSRWMNIGKQGTNIRFMQGRLLCDLASDGAKSMIQSTSWSLTEMCQSQLKITREDIDPDDTASFFDATVSSPDRLLHFIQHCELDAFLQMALAHKIQMLPLTRQLTNLAGNSWNKTLNGGRAERNEYILLHEFHRLKYIPPDKTWAKKSGAAAAKVEAAEDAEGGAAPTTTKAKRDKYKGGLVFEPKRGLWDKYILVMDFNSLYPSIIQEYNIDFTTIDKTDDESAEDKIPAIPSGDVPQGVLPRLIATLVNRRRQVKSLMKDRNATQSQLIQWDIKQKALKLTANSMYGCLGFEHSRFYARPLAALTTFKGREILTHTRELAEGLALDVIYGDTDSIFVNSNVTDLPDALKIANELKKAVNDRYRLLEIDLDGIFRRMLLLQKKKYAAVKVEEMNASSVEIKGLDMKRREYCMLSKNISGYILDQILSGDDAETVVERIHEYLKLMGENIRGGKVEMEDFIVFKRLGKAPEDYPKDNALPHVHVARRMKERGGHARIGDVIPYIFCLGGDGSSVKTGQADRAYHPDELRKADSELKIDFEYYIAQQILPPVERLCDPIEGTDRARLAECLGLDPARFQVSVASIDEDPYRTLDSQIPDKERFRDAAQFIVRCRKCEGSAVFSPVGSAEMPVITSAGVMCPGCSTPYAVGSIQAQLETQLRQQINQYYAGWTICEDATCGHRTRGMSVYGKRCLNPACAAKGPVTYEYSDLKLYNQLLYYASLFDGQKAVANATGTSREAEVLCSSPFGQPFFRRPVRHTLLLLFIAPTADRVDLHSFNLRLNKFNSNKMVSSMLIYALLASASLVSSRPLARTRSVSLTERQSIFPLRDYADFQISTGVAGDALARAEAVFKTPLNGIDLATVSDEDLDNLNTMRGAASKFETTDFNPAIKAATGEEADALQRGKIANKVLKNLGSVMVASIKELNNPLYVQEAKAKAAGEDASEFTTKIKEETTKMNKNAATDKADAGKTLATPLSSGIRRVRSVKFRMRHATIKRQSLMPLRDYADFQISTGVAGDALARAEAVFKTPFDGVNLATVSDEDLDNLNTMRGAASKFETTDFNPAIKAATGEEAAALQRGKIANKVLKNLGSAMVASIKQAKAEAAGKDASAFATTVTEETAKLNKNAATDKGDVGKALATPLKN
ncbi:DNA polymerase II [Ceratobasidium theobromae]|uniref:DNA polymerase n=1 Tax=Ceratobasidium theobromae TaxID=1582974 RepID=A0A5N5QDD8_9AGAM|nr:DNA polymerase II [Ceratobasidium theobromae]